MGKSKEFFQSSGNMPRNNELLYSVNKGFKSELGGEGRAPLLALLANPHFFDRVIYFWVDIRLSVICQFAGNVAPNPKTDVFFTFYVRKNL